MCFLLAGLAPPTAEGSFQKTYLAKFDQMTLGDFDNGEQKLAIGSNYLYKLSNAFRLCPGAENRDGRGHLDARKRLFFSNVYHHG